MLSLWKRVRYRLEWIGLLIAARLIPLLSRKSCFHLAQMLGAIISILDRDGYRVALKNLEIAFGDELSQHDRRKIARESFQHFARTMVDFLWSPNLTRECLSMACGFAGLNSTIIAQEFRNSLLDPIFRAIRERAGHELIPRKSSIVRLYKVLRRKGTTALLVDLTVRPRHGVVIDCFGLKKPVTSAHAWLHERTGVPIIPAHCEPLSDGRYRIIFHPRIDHTAGITHQQIAQACWNSFEPYLRKKPAPWLWMYKHWRYRPANADRPYPFYVRASRGFEKIIQRDQANSIGRRSNWRDSVTPTVLDNPRDSLQC